MFENMLANAIEKLDIITTTESYVITDFEDPLGNKISRILFESIFTIDRNLIYVAISVDYGSEFILTDFISYVYHGKDNISLPFDIVNDSYDCKNNLVFVKIEADSKGFVECFYRQKPIKVYISCTYGVSK